MIKIRKRKILLLPGDGVGPEVITEVRKIIEWFNKKKSLDFQIEEGLDDIALSLRESTKISLYEKNMMKTKPWIN